MPAKEAMFIAKQGILTQDFCGLIENSPQNYLRAYVYYSFVFLLPKNFDGSKGTGGFSSSECSASPNDRSIKVA